jgi:TetR/AcrR family macrolide resistance operon transcriptional repressor
MSVQETVIKRDVGRPRVFSDDAIFHATDVVLRRNGYPDLTLEAIAEEVGCTRQALVRRFGSKRILLLSYLETMEERVTTVYQREMDIPASPLEVLRIRLTQPWAQRFVESVDHRAQANILAFMLTLSSEPELAARFAALNGLGRDGIETLLQAAMDDGELRSINPRAMAQVLYDVWIGETVNWCVDPASPLSERLSRALALLLDPYRPSSA